MLIGLGCLLLVLLIASSPTTVTELPPSITIFYSNDVQNELYRSGGLAYQAGGLSRRATAIETDRSPDKLIVDVGNFSARHPGKEYDEFKLEYLLRAYELMGYSVLNAGPLELARGEAGLKLLAEQTGDHLISANLANASGARVLPPFRVVEVKDLKVGFVGLTNAEVPTGVSVLATDPLQALDPMTSLQSVWDQLEKESDLQILLSELSDEQNIEISKAFPSLDVILGGPDWEMNTQMRPWDERGVVIGKVGARGKYLGRVTLTLDGSLKDGITVGAFNGEAIELGASIEENPAITELLDESKWRLRAGEVLPVDFEPHGADQQFGYAGAIYCQMCHGEIYAGWRMTDHGQALQALAEKGEQNNPGCLECHTVGYAEPGGYRAKESTYLLANVQCESCHGSGSDHMRVAQAALIKQLPIQSDWKVTTVRTPESTCIKCHNTDNDPHWKDGVWPYETMVQQIGCSQWLAEPQGN